MSCSTSQSGSLSGTPNNAPLRIIVQCERQSPAQPGILEHSCTQLGGSLHQQPLTGSLRLDQSGTSLLTLDHLHDHDTLCGSISTPRDCMAVRNMRVLHKSLPPSAAEEELLPTIPLPTPSGLFVDVSCTEDAPPAVARNMNFGNLLSPQVLNTPAGNLNTINTAQSGSSSPLGPRDGISEIIKDVLYLSGVRGTANRRKLDDLNISCFLDVAVDVPVPHHIQECAPGSTTLLRKDLVNDIKAAGGCCGGSGPYEYVHLPLYDRGDQKLSDYFVTTFAFIRACRNAGRPCLLFCREGKSRSAAIAIAFVMSELKFTYEEAFGYVRRCRKQVDPNISFCTQLSDCSPRSLPTQEIVIPPRDRRDSDAIEEQRTKKSDDPLSSIMPLHTSCLARPMILTPGSQNRSRSTSNASNNADKATAMHGGLVSIEDCHIGDSASFMLSPERTRAALDEAEATEIV